MNIGKMTKLSDNIKKVKSFTMLSKGWDGGGAHPIPLKAAKDTIVVLRALSPQPEVFPTANKSIILEYGKYGEAYIGIEISEMGGEIYINDDENKE